jgi:DNA polymerase elongation subunit (family B)
MHDSFRLIAFNPYDAEKETEGAGRKEKEFLIQMFGINEKGKTASIYVEGYQPFFWIKVGADWKESHKMGFVAQLRKEMGWLGTDIASSKLLNRKKLYGFDGGKDHRFLLIKFHSEQAMRKAKSCWYWSETKNGIYRRRLWDSGYEYGSYSTYLYEAQIPPLLRMFHIREISPSGWIALPHRHAKKHKKVKSTSCTYEYTINYRHIIPLPQKETVVPYKMMSFDIEASSSHGDFPLAVKDYKKLATNILDVWSDRVSAGEDSDIEYLCSVIKTAFQIPGHEEENIETVYPKTVVPEADIDIIFKDWVATDPTRLKGYDLDNPEAMDLEEENECDEGATTEAPEESGNAWNRPKKPKAYKGKGTIVTMLNNPDADRDTKLMELTKTLTQKFPSLEGDNVTFIGSTFLRYGEDTPYMNHCIARDTCSDIPQVENSVIESYKTEKEVLLAWTKLVQREDPDIVVGYNIFGFDYQFMFLRAKELGCQNRFLQLSRNKREVCIKKDWRTGKEGLEENTLFIASGQHDLKFIKMNGRLQVDLYNFFRRDYQLTKYKLDYVSGYFIGDRVNEVEHHDGRTKIFSKNLTGLENNSFVNFEEAAHSVDTYKDGQKFEVFEIDRAEGTFWIDSIESPDMSKRVRWGLAKDDVTPQDIFRMTHEGPDERAKIAKYCIQDCNLVHHLMRKIDVLTGFIEMSSLCSVPLDFLVMRGQGIKLTSYIAKKCREKRTLMPVIDKSENDEGYEGAIVLPPKCALYLDDPVACVDYSSLYPSVMVSENVSHDSKVLTREYDLENKLLVETGEKDDEGGYIYDNLPDYKYVDIKYDTYRWQRKNGNPKAAMEKVKVGCKICRFAQFPDGKKGIMPAILEELLAARKATRKLIPQQKDEFMKNVLDKRQISIKVTANSMYGQTGAKTSSFYDVDCAASTTAVGRLLLTYAQRVIEEAYDDIEVETICHGRICVKAEYVYGDTDSVFFKFNPTELDGTKIIGQKALEVTIELAQEAGKLASKFLKRPHDLEYEKTYLPFCLLSKKRYVGMLFELDPFKSVRKSMGIVLKRRDNAPIVKDVYGGVIDILMKDKDVEKAVSFLRKCLDDIIEEKCGMDKLVITKSLRSGYKNPKQIAHKVLADRIGKRDPGSKPSIGDRVAFVYVENPDKKALQGDRIETPEFVKANGVSINYSFYITNQIMKPIQQVFALVLEDLVDFRKKKGHTLRKWKKELEELRDKYPDPIQYRKKEEALRNKEVKALIFDRYLRKVSSKKGNQTISEFFATC